MNQRHLIAASCTALMLLATSSAMAQASKTAGPASINKQSDGLHYDFKDADNLQASAHGANGLVIPVRGKPVRRTLIRPRSSFVAQMLRSVEHI